MHNVPSPPTNRVLDAALVRLVIVAATLMFAVFVVIGRSQAAFVATAGSNDNTASAASVTLTANGGGSQMFSITNMTPSSTETQCIDVTYTGGIDPGPVRLYGSLDAGPSTGLQTYLNIQIEQGTWAGDVASAFPDCTNFTGGSVIYATNDLLTFFSTHSDYATGLAGWDPTTNGEYRVYRITLTLDDNDAAQGTSAQFDLGWETQS